jgi:hypothetical protein
LIDCGRCWPTNNRKPSTANENAGGISSGVGAHFRDLLIALLIVVEAAFAWLVVAFATLWPSVPPALRTTRVGTGFVATTTTAGSACTRASASGVVGTSVAHRATIAAATTAAVATATTATEAAASTAAAIATATAAAEAAATTTSAIGRAWAARTEATATAAATEAAATTATWLALDSFAHGDRATVQ